MNKEELLISSLKSLGLDPTEHQIDQFIKYYELLIEKNKVMNLTAITDYEDVVIKHFKDSLTVKYVLDIGQQSIIDIGTGAGFPGIPLKIMYPETKITLLDSLQKRLLFLDDVITQLDLKQISTIHGRSEDIAHDPKYREKYDICVSRAVANLSTLCELTLPFLKLHGVAIYYKADHQKTHEEIQAAKTALSNLNATLKETKTFYLTDNTQERTLLLLEKTAKTPSKYPRKAPLPSKKPL